MIRCSLSRLTALARLGSVADTSLQLPNASIIAFSSGSRLMRVMIIGVLLTVALSAVFACPLLAIAASDKV